MGEVFPDLTCEIALASQPDDDPQVFTDVSTYMVGFGSTRGATDERALVDTGTITVRLKNSDGRFTPSNGSSPYSPNLKLQRRLRIRGGWANGITNPSFETDASTWGASGAATVSRVTAQQKFGAASGQAVTTNVTDSGIILDSGSCPAAAPGDVWSGAAWMRGAGTVTLRVRALSAANAVLATYTSAALALDSTWRRLGVTTTALPASTAKVQIWVATNSAQGVVTFQTDGYTLAKFPYLVPFLETAGGMATQFEGFIESYRDVVQNNGFETIAELDVVDVMKPLAYFRLPCVLCGSPPPETYRDMVIGTQPWIYLPFDELEGTEAQNYGRAEGQNGRYKNQPAKGVATLVVGGNDAAVDLELASSHFINLTGIAKFAANRDEPHGFGKSGGFTPGVLFKPESIGTSQVLVSGDYSSTRDDNVWQLRIDTAGKLRMNVRVTTGGGTLVESVGTTTLAAGTIYHLAGVVRLTFVASVWRVRCESWVNGSFEAFADLIVTPGAGNTMPLATSNNLDIRFGSSAVGGGAAFADGVMQHGFVYDIDAQEFLPFLSAARTAGFDEQLSGARVNSILDLLPDAWSDRSVGTGDRTMQRRRQFGQPALDELRLVEAAENGRLWVSRAGVVTFGDAGYRADPPYNTTQIALSNVPVPPTSYPYRTFEKSPLDDAYLYNTVRVQKTGSVFVQESVDATSVADHFERDLEVGEVIVTTDAQADAIADELLARYKDPVQRIVGVELDGGYDTDGEIWRAILERDLEHQVAVTFDAPAAPAFTQTSRIKMVSHTVGGIGAGRKWTTTWGLAPSTV